MLGCVYLSVTATALASFLIGKDVGSLVLSFHCLGPRRCDVLMQLQVLVIRSTAKGFARFCIILIGIIFEVRQR